MPTPPELPTPTVTPATALERFERLRDQYRMGIIDLPAFTSALEVYQFPYEQGVLWTIGATSGSWYRWNGAGWEAGHPPAQLRLPPMPLELAPDAARPALAAGPAPQTGSREKRCSACGTWSIGKKFCTSCGTRLG